MTATASSQTLDPGLDQQMYGWAEELFPICRSITGDGVRQTLGYIKKIVPELEIHEVPTGTQAFDWVVPDEWNIKDAYVLDESGDKVVDFKQCNLHIMGYSEPVDMVVSLEELQKHLHSIAERPGAIPYVTSYYERQWGFCLSENQRKKLKPGNYRVVIDATLEPGSLTYGEIILPGREQSEILLSTYICHPSLANNELSGPVVATALAGWLSSLKDRRYTYRIVLGPETIGAIVYLSRHLAHLKNHMVAGFNISCVGDDRAYTYLASRNGKTLADRVAQHVLGCIAPDYVSYSFLHRGSDERQYCAPGVDLPMASVMRTRYGDYPEYHSSDDDLSVMSPAGLGGGFEAIRRCLLCLENNETLAATTLCEPQLGKRDLISNTGHGAAKMSAYRRNVSNLLAYSDGTNDLLAIAEITNTPMWELIEAKDILKGEGLLQ